MLVKALDITLILLFALAWFRMAMLVFIYAKRVQIGNSMTNERREMYRKVARSIYGNRGEASRLTVDIHANVMECEGGAFVEAQVWVPKTAVEEDKDKASS